MTDAEGRDRWPLAEGKVWITTWKKQKIAAFSEVAVNCLLSGVGEWIAIEMEQ